MLFIFAFPRRCYTSEALVFSYWQPSHLAYWYFLEIYPSILATSIAGKGAFQLTSILCPALSVQKRILCSASVHLSVFYGTGSRPTSRIKFPTLPFCTTDNTIVCLLQSSPTQRAREEMFFCATRTARTTEPECGYHRQEAHELYKRLDRLLHNIWKTQDKDVMEVCFANSASALKLGTWEWVGRYKVSSTFNTSFSFPIFALQSYLRARIIEPRPKRSKIASLRRGRKHCEKKVSLGSV